MKRSAATKLGLQALRFSLRRGDVTDDDRRALGDAAREAGRENLSAEYALLRHVALRCETEEMTADLLGQLSSALAATGAKRSEDMVEEKRPYYLREPYI